MVETMSQPHSRELVSLSTARTANALASHKGKTHPSPPSYLRLRASSGAPVFLSTTTLPPPPSVPSSSRSSRPLLLDNSDLQASASLPRRACHPSTPALHRTPTQLRLRHPPHVLGRCPLESRRAHLCSSTLRSEIPSPARASPGRYATYFAHNSALASVLSAKTTSLQHSSALQHATLRSWQIWWTLSTSARLLAWRGRRRALYGHMCQRQFGTVSHTFSKAYGLARVRIRIINVSSAYDFTHCCCPETGLGLELQLTARPSSHWMRSSRVSQSYETASSLHLCLTR
ncbi:hypothetical protein C8Q80DRAFT_656572 [Daedaleopsis nitida]|nr:hypothetical protein C8Q80DRAFT_656572 [Daedaleopsis nitida]